MCLSLFIINMFMEINHTCILLWTNIHQHTQEVDQLQQAVTDKTWYAGLTWLRMLGRKVMICFHISCGNLECSTSTHGIFTISPLKERKRERRGVTMESSWCKRVCFVLYTVVCALRRVVQLLFVATDTQAQGLWASMLKVALDHRGVLENSGNRL